MAHGVDAVVELIDESGWSYPVSVERLERKHGLANVKLDGDGKYYTTLVELLSRGDLDRFDSESDLREQVEPLVDAEIRSRQSGIVGWVKRTFLN